MTDELKAEREEWRVVDDFPCYEVSNFGRIRRGNNILAQTATKKGYLTVNLSMHGHASRRMVHRVVLEAFVGKRPEGMHGCHLDGNKNNNRLRNITWATPSENESHKSIHGTKSFGERNGNHKFSDSDIRKIRMMKSQGGAKWGALKIAKELGVNISAVVSVSTNKYWKHIK